MSNSLRILRFGVLNVKGKCEKRFEKLMFFQGKVAGLPFSISQMTSNLKHMELNGAGSSHDFEISPSDLQRLRNLRVVQLINFEAWRQLPAELGEIIHELRELNLSGCTSIKEIPRSISKLQYLRVLNMEECYGLTGLPEDIGSLSCLQKLNLSECKHIKELPESTSKLRVDWVRELHSKGKLLEAVDPRLLNEYPVEEVGLVLELGLLCSHPHPEARPSMREIVQMLAGDKAHPVPPSEPPSADTPTRTKNLDEFIVSFSSYKHGSFIAISHPNRSSDGRLVFTPDRTSPLSLLATTARKVSVIKTSHGVTVVEKTYLFWPVGA